MEIHPSFRLNGKSFSKEDILEVAYSLIKEGETFERAIGDFLMDWFSKDAFIEVKTSGSTGIPKTLKISKQHMVNSAIATGTFFNLKEKDIALLCLPAEYIAGKMMLVRAFVLGMELDLVEPSSNPLDETNKQYDFCAMVPLQVENSLNKLDQLKTLIIGGAPVSNLLNEKLLGKSTDLFETFGMTETITHIAARKVGLEHFETLPNIQIAKDERGCLIIDAPKISDSKIITNDLVDILSETSFQWLGRFDYVINSGGIKLIPETIEKKLSSVIDGRFFVSGVSDDVLGEKLVLVVEGEGNEANLKSQILSSPLFEKYEVPKQICFVESFVQTSSGKINRKLTLSKAI